MKLGQFLCYRYNVYGHDLFNFKIEEDGTTVVYERMMKASQVFKN